MNVEQAVALLARTTGDDYRLIGRLTGGETGAHEVAGPAGERLVMKWDTVPSSQAARREAVVLSERLRTDAEWPVPRQRTVVGPDCLFVLQDFMPGAPVAMIGHDMVDRLLELHRNRLGLARPGDRSRWPGILITTLTVGGNGYCLHQSLRDHDERTARLLARIEDVGHRIDPRDLPGHDIVHWDLHPGNLLQDHGSLSAVVDTDHAAIGDAAFDLVLLALGSLSGQCEKGVRSRLFAAAFDGLGELRRRAYLSHFFLRLLDWSIRRGREDEIEFWLDQSQHMLGG
jgi:hypothetical protein